WATLLTRHSYLPGVIVLDHSFRKHRSRYPLVVLTTDTLPQSCIKVLDVCGIPRRHVDMIDPPEKVNIAAERFADTWTKLRVFEMVEYDKVALIDGDMLIRRNMDEVMTENVGGIPMEGKCYIEANHACVCNAADRPWAPPDWLCSNCAYTPISHPDALAHPTPVPTHPLPDKRLRAYTLLNSGLVIFTPTSNLFENMMNYLSTTPLLKTFIFPDQDFLAAFFINRWRPIGWQYNAIKTLRYEHSQVWRDDEVRNCHYIVDKPWKVGRTRKVDEGKDALTHGWWWEDWK
ncbi:nucleotide-diphospho-sugar transferase, partial [Peziza echinospora]